MVNIFTLLLAAGYGTRLKPYTDDWPKCLMPISRRPLLEYWLSTLHENSVEQVLVNIHHHRHQVQEFLARERFLGWVSSVYEENLLGTAGTVRHNSASFWNSTLLLIHADNWCQCDFSKFIKFHLYSRPNHTVMTMMTFRTEQPNLCGIVETDKEGVVQRFYEKNIDPPGNLANAAVYLLEPEVLLWIKQNPLATDFSTDVLPNFVGRVATWENTGILRDIGEIQSLLQAQNDLSFPTCWTEPDQWDKEFQNNPIHKRLTMAAR